jgi:hypothetical protein
MILIIEKYGCRLYNNTILKKFPEKTINAGEEMRAKTPAGTLVPAGAGTPEVQWWQPIGEHWPEISLLAYSIPLTGFASLYRAF